MKTITKYIADDGSEHRNADAALANKTMTFTPHQNHLLLSIHLYPDTLLRSAASRGVQQLLDAGLLDTKLNLTDKGRAHVAQICALEAPVEAWVGSNGKLIQL